tara:strand:+ start:72 stop:767 length:696 start_codon:yes stop_codon:yes gene_type:complete
MFSLNIFKKKIAFRYIKVPIEDIIYCPVPKLPKTISGTPMNGDWDISDNNISIFNHTKIKMCLDHWINGKSWEETGIIDLHLYHVREYGKSTHGCTRKDFMRRYKRLDELREKIRNNNNEDFFLGENKNKTKHFNDGILFHISTRSRIFDNLPKKSLYDELKLLYPNFKKTSSNNNSIFNTWKNMGIYPLFGGSGCHRLSIALSLGLNYVPGALGIWHTKIDKSTIRTLIK